MVVYSYAIGEVVVAVLVLAEVSMSISSFQMG
jgi:hypothetical protein